MPRSPLRKPARGTRSNRLTTSPGFTNERILLSRSDHPANANTRPRYAIEGSAWIAHPDFGLHDSFTATFERHFTLSAPATFTLHVTADQRYHLYLNGQLLSRGPDRCDAHHWAFASYRIDLPAGPHALRADVLWLAQHRPYAQIAVEPGFQLAVAEAPVDFPALDTGLPGWRVRGRRLDGLRPPLPDTFHVVGPGYTLRTRDESFPPRWCEPAASLRRWWGNGVLQPGRRLDPSPLPEQLWRERSLGRVRGLRFDLLPDTPWQEAAVEAVAPWQALIDDATPVIVPPHSQVEVLFDLEDYVCGYPHLRARGRGASLEWTWDEALYLNLPRDGGAKGHRDQIAGKRFRGFGDRFELDRACRRPLAPLWWRAGRFLRWRIETGAEPLQIERAWIAETRYPLDVSPAIELPDPRLTAALPVLCRGLEASLHETFTDSPFYEQMMYAGDTRLEALCLYSRAHDDRPQRRAIELFEWSRHVNGWPASRYPSAPHQLIAPFGLLWVAMVRDFAWWRDDAAFVRARLQALRDTLEQWLELRDATGLAVGPPGWSYVDLVSGWTRGIPPGTDHGGSASINLQLVHALEAMADLEAYVGDPVLGTRWTGLAAAVYAALRRSHADPANGVLRESILPATWSEHAAALTVLTRYATPTERAAAVAFLLAPPVEAARANVYFEFYVHAALLSGGQSTAVWERLEFWRSLPEHGFRAPPEFRADESRSDCHGWTSHLLHTLHAGFAGVTPVEPGFRRVRVAPQPGPLPWLRARVTHPRGEIAVDLEFDGNGGASGTVTLPEGVNGTWQWNGQVQPLQGGANRIAAVSVS